MKTIIHYFGKNAKKGQYINKKEKQAQGFKVERARLTLLFCATAVEFMIRTALIYLIELLTPGLEGKKKQKKQLSIFMTRRPGQ